MYKKFFSKEDEKKILDAIQHAEKDTSGEIRVHIDINDYPDTIARTRAIFVKLGMRKTKLKNGVLFYLDTKGKKFAIMGDDEIDEKVPEKFWESTKDIVIENFKKGNFANGIAEGVKKAGEQLAEFFPFEKGDVNELSDAISYEEIGEANEK
ncbi:TPM domain-containing protein [bacterium]|nr:TPM domain-containing protein [bacterium]